MAIFPHEPAPSPPSSTSAQPSDDDASNRAPTPDSTQPASPSDWPPLTSCTQPNSLTLDNPSYFRFVSDLPFKLRFTTIDYPFWARQPAQPLRYLPVPLAPMPNMPQIPEQEAYEFIHLSSAAYVKMVVDEMLLKYQYGDLCHVDIVCVYMGFTHRNGQRARVRASVENVGLITMAWAKDVFLDRLHPGYCVCDECKRDGCTLGHGFEMEVVFQQGVDRLRDGVGMGEKKQTFGGKQKLPFRSNLPLRSGVGGGGGREYAVKKVRFDCGGVRRD